jgi:DNA polymerase-3 subunit epsilon
MFAIIDVEASGGNPKKDRLTEIAIFIHNGQRVIEEYCTLINPETYITPFITSMTGITNEMVAEAPRFADIAPRINELTKGRVFVAHNVRFDYSFLNNEFKRLGLHFIRKQLCTVRLSKKILPGLSSYSLGRLCAEVGIPVEHRHRAFGDAAATVELFDLMLKTGSDSITKETLKQEIKESILPPNLDREALATLPEETGVYYFKDEKGRIIYIGKSTNIRSRVLSHFSEDMNSLKHHGIKKKIFNIEYELTGSELLALVLESQEIKRWMPEYNTAQRRKKYKYGIYEETDKYGYKNLKLKMLQLDEPVIHINNRRRGEDILLSLAGEHGLCHELCSVPTSSNGCLNYHSGICGGACLGKENVENYNTKVISAISRYRYDNPNFIILGEGRRPEEKSVICVENGQYVGYGFLDETAGPVSSPLQARDFIKPQEDHPDIQNIIRSYLRKKVKGTEVIAY